MRIVAVIATGLLCGSLASVLPLDAPATDANAQSVRAADAPPPARRHTAVQKRELRLVAATVAPVTRSSVEITVTGDRREIRSNGIPVHRTGTFPNMGNPHAIRAQRVDVSLPLNPTRAAAPTHFDLGIFGIALNGVILEPQAAEWYLGQRGSAWQYEPLGGAVALGLDTQYAHVQRSGKYHYHGVPEGLISHLGVRGGAESPIVGWAYDGFPIYALFAKVDGAVREMRSGYTLKSGPRPTGGNNPGGTHDGTFTADYQWTGAGDLDECNGAVIRTADFPNGTYAYFLTRSFPVIPRCFAGRPVEEFEPLRRG